MTRILSIIAVLLFSAFLLPADYGASAQSKDKAADQAKPAQKPKHKFTISPETTYILGPLDKDGYIDYAAALNERLSKGVTPDNNANVLIWKAIGPSPDGRPMPAEFFKMMGMDPPPEKGEYFVDLAKFLKAEYGIDATKDDSFDQLQWCGQRPWSAKDHPRIAAWLKANERPLAVITEATNRPRYFVPQIPNQSEIGAPGLHAARDPGPMKCREISTALTARAMFRAAEGELMRGWQDVMTCCRLGQLNKSDSSNTSPLIGIFIESIANGTVLGILGQGKLNTKELATCRQDLTSLLRDYSLADLIEWPERYRTLDVAMSAHRLGPRGLDRLFTYVFDESPSSMVDKNGKLVFADIDWNAMMVKVNRCHDRLSQALRTPDRKTRDKSLAQIERDFSERFFRKEGQTDTQARAQAIKDAESPSERGLIIAEYYTSPLCTASKVILRVMERAEQNHRNLLLAFTLEIHQREHGQYPKELAALVPKYLQEIPGDLFSGKALFYRPADKGYLLYSIGSNGKDDGGRGYDDDPMGDDLVVRMPLPALKK